MEACVAGATDDLGARLGPVSSAWLAGIGVTTVAQLAARGVIPLCVELRAAGHPVSANLAYALTAALRHLDWRALPGPERLGLKAELHDAFAALARRSSTSAPAPAPATGT
jgi:hypothetical protein